MPHPPARPRRRMSSLRGLVLLLAVAEVGVAAYVWYALYVDDTTAWIGTLLEGTNDLWQALVVPFAAAGALAFALAAADRLLWAGLAVALAAPVLTLWQLA